MIAYSALRRLSGVYCFYRGNVRFIPEHEAGNTTYLEQQSLQKYHKVQNQPDAQHEEPQPVNLLLDLRPVDLAPAVQLEREAPEAQQESEGPEHEGEGEEGVESLDEEGEDEHHGVVEGDGV